MAGKTPDTLAAALAAATWSPIGTGVEMSKLADGAVLLRMTPVPEKDRELTSTGVSHKVAYTLSYVPLGDGTKLTAMWIKPLPKGQRPPRG